MSVHHTSVTEEARDDAGMNLKKIVLVGVVSLILFAISAVVAWGIIVADTKSLQQQWGVAEEPKEIGRDEIGLVDQVLFDTDRRLEDWTAAKRKQLQTYGWVDRSKGIIHIPIDKAIEQVIAEGGKEPTKPASPAAPAPSAPASPAPSQNPESGSGR
jgi:hypothetical protein